LVEGKWVLLIWWVLCVSTEKKRHSVWTDTPRIFSHYPAKETYPE